MSLRFLVVDDSELNLKVTETILARSGYKVDSVCCAADAYSLLSSNDYDIVLMDYLMPEVNGLTAAAHIREMADTRHDAAYYKKLPIILLTADDDISSLEDIPGDSINDILRKPFLTADISRLTDKWCTAPDDTSIYGIEDKTLAEMISADRKGFEGLLSLFAADIPGKHERIDEALQNADYTAYTVEVHRIKGEARMIGAEEISTRAYTLELAGKSITGILSNGSSEKDNILLIKRETPGLLNYLDHMRSDIMKLTSKGTSSSDSASADDKSASCDGCSSSEQMPDMQKLRRYVTNASEALSEGNTELAGEWIDEVLKLIK